MPNLPPKEFLVNRAGLVGKDWQVRNARLLPLFAGVSLFLSLLVPAPPAEASQVTCTPTAGFTDCIRFPYTGSIETLTVPAGFVTGNYLHIEIWGAGGGGSTYNGAWTPNSGGGAGGYSSTAIDGVVAGDTFTVLVGQGGLSNSATRAFGGGGLAGGVSSGARASGGGGMSGLFLDADLDEPLLIAGGGGGGSPGSNADGNPGGGGAIGNAPNSGGSRAGAPGTLTAGGAAATSPNCTKPATPGSRYQGGDGAAPGELGGGGGGGYFGGGGGSCQSGGGLQNGGGGGGSGYVSTSRVIVLRSGNGGQGPLGSAGGAVSSLGTVRHGSGGQYLPGIGVGGAGSTAQSGGNGMVVVQWSTVPQPPSQANPDTSVGKAGVVQSIAQAQANDTLPVGFNWVVSSIRLCTQAEALVAASSRSCTVGNNVATRASPASEGQFRVNTANGSISFTPDAGFSGDATGVTYQISDDAGRLFWSTYTPSVIGPPVTSPDTSSADFGSIQSLQVLSNDQFDPRSAVNATSLRICTTATAMGSCTSTALQVANVGKFEAVSGQVKFTPCTANGSPYASPSCTVGFVGTHSIQYRIADSLGQTSTASISVTTAPPEISANSQTKSVLPSSSVSFTSIVGSGGLASGVGLVACLVSSGTSCGSNTVTISGQGTFTLDTGTRIVRFTALSTITPGGSNSITYRVTDAANQIVTASLTVIVPLPPTAMPDNPVGAAGASQRIAVLANDSPGDASSPILPSSLALCPSPSATVSQCILPTLTIAGKGVYSVGSDGAITFTPEVGYDGLVDDVKYLVRDALGQAATATISTMVLPPPAPATSPDVVISPYAGSAVFRPIVNDTVGMPTSGYTEIGTAELNPTTLRLCGPSDTVASCSETVVTTAAGTYSLNVANGEITFMPVVGFSGRDLSAPNYSVCLSVSGTWAPQSPSETCSFGSLDVSVASAPPPTTVADSVTGPMSTQLSAAVASNDSAAQGLTIQPRSVQLCADGETVPENCNLTSLSTPDGDYSVDSATGRVTFNPDHSFSGVASAVSYSVADSAGNMSIGTVQFESVQPSPTQTLSTTGMENSNQSVTVAIPAGGSVILLDDQSNPVTTLVTQGGLYMVDTSSGLITFTPDPGFIGQAPVAQIQLVDRFGQTSISTYGATVTQTPPPAAPTLAADSFTTTAGIRLFGSVATNDSAPQGGTFAITSQSVSGVLTFAIDGSFNYLPLAGFVGLETFSYSVCHPAPNSAICSTETVQITITAELSSAPSAPSGVIRAEAAQSSAVQTSERLTASTPVPTDNKVGLSSCLVFEGVTCSDRIVVSEVGTFEQTPDNRVEFSPAAGFFGAAVIEQRWSRGGDIVRTDRIEFFVAAPTEVLETRITNRETATLAAGPQASGVRCLVVRADALCQTTLRLAGTGLWSISKTGRVTFTPERKFVGASTVWLRWHVAEVVQFTEFAVSVTKAKARPPVRLILSGFNDGSPALLQRFKNQIRIFINRHSDYATIRCTGQTEGPTILRTDAQLAQSRADNACRYAIGLKIGSFIRLKGTVLNSLTESPSLRRAVIYLSD